MIVAHYRENSLTHAVAGRFVEGLKTAGHEVELLDLYKEHFDPLLREVDEPTWGQLDKTYSEETHRRMDQMRRNDALAFVFPVWWYNMPAILKGYLDRVWCYGYAYGSGCSLAHQKVQWLCLVGEPEERFKRHKYDEMMTHYLTHGLAGFTGIKESQVEFLYDTIAGKREYFEQEVLPRAYEIGMEF